MLKSILAEECTRTKLAPSLEKILNDLDRESTHHDYIVALIIVLLAEAGFYLSSSYSDRPQWYALSSIAYFLVINCIIVYCKMHLSQSKTTLYTKKLEIARHGNI